MNLRTRLMLLPVIAISLMILLAAGAGYVIYLERGALEQSRFRSGLETAIVEVRASSVEATSSAYRLINVAGAIDEGKIKSERARIAKAYKELSASLMSLADQDPDGIGLYAFDLTSTIDLLAKKVDSAIDLAMVDPNTGSSAMQSADVLSRDLEQNISVAFDAARESSQVMAGERVAAEQMTIIGLGVAALLAAGLLVVGGVLLGGSITGPLNDAIRVAKTVAEGDLECEVDIDGVGEIADLQQALVAMQSSLRDIVSQVRDSSTGIGNASAEIASGNNDLSARTEEAASSIEETAASVDHLTQTVRTNADNARQANQLALSASEVAARGGKVVGDVVSTMDSITHSSRRIAEIISVIDGIAFQTNILALNAAVEAARAGEQGRGFAVVAAEVRNLAQRSSAAANEIKELITTSVSEVDSGARLVKSAGDTMTEIVGSVRRVTDIIGEISAATSEQSTQIDEVNTAVTQLDQMTQQNAALVEESAAAAESLRDQAGALNQLVNAFKLGDGAKGSPVSTRPQAKPSPIQLPSNELRKPVSTPKEKPEKQHSATPSYDKPIARRDTQSARTATPGSSSSAGAPVQSSKSKPAPARVSAPAATAATAVKHDDDEWETF